MNTSNNSIDTRLLDLTQASLAGTWESATWWDRIELLRAWQIIPENANWSNTELYYWGIQPRASMLPVTPGSRNVIDRLTLAAIYEYVQTRQPAA